MRALFALALLWLSAVPVVILLLRRLPEGPSYTFVAGSSFFVGALLAAASVPLSDAIFGTLHAAALGGTYLGLAAAAALASGFAKGVTAREEHQGPRPDGRTSSHAAIAVTLVTIAWLFGRLWVLMREATVKPLLAWDGWELWAAKAKVWVMKSELVAFYPPTAIGRIPIPEGFFASTKHPDGLPWLLTWFSILGGGWDERVIGYLYVALLAAVCLSVFGAVRMVTRNPLAASLAAAGLGTIPYLNAQVALPGYADIWVAAYFVYGAMILCLFSRRPLDHAALALLALAAVACVTLKSTGLIWAGMLVAGLVVAARPGLRWIAYGGLAAAVLVVVLSTPGEIWLPLKMRQWSLDLTNVTDPLLRVLLSFRDWNILCWIGIVSALARAMLPVADRSLHVLDVVLVGSLMILVTGFYYSGLSFWVTEFTGVNRGLLPLASLVVLWAVLSLEHVSRSSKLRDRQYG